MKNFEFEQELDIAWCPGCGNFNIRTSLIEALQELELEPEQVVISSGIGQAAKMPQYIDVNYFNGLHGRALPVAVAIKAANPDLTVIAEGGDGDMYGEGGNHFIHNIRRNPNIAHLVHNNMVYGLTKGQASPTSKKSMQTPVQTSGVANEPFNPLAVALSLGATFVARAFSGYPEQTKEIIKQAITHEGYALVDIFHPCVTFNKINNFKWYKNNCYQLSADYNRNDFNMAMEKALDVEHFALGVLYQKQGQPTFEQQLPVYQNNQQPIVHRKRDLDKVSELLSL
ncbi:thiamine pyrophosphate-dependent enzyme [Desulfuribacillus alkaliarsenatis]|uniref:2-oxoacid ferredoxin oxidoreductase n=1 Tax=Desulfuribacillus alkaliarsenatis TaxID=766136 RepID=A0A1E5G5B9_9FIRM|nr:thiamine pyrophosphate-dependent enzyme [Desulfuribacillus alkaliarsenatis]OEF98382.1 2-oxoacid ferredoxin oxidoreductase [Desulfuribacillus alkaliarsenatis]